MNSVLLLLGIAFRPIISMWLLRGCLLFPRLWCTLTVRPDSGHGQSLAKRNSPPVFLWKGERKIVSSSLEMWTTIYKTQASLAATSFPCERKQLLAIGITLNTQIEREKSGIRASHCHIQILCYNCSRNPGAFLFCSSTDCWDTLQFCEI